MQMFHEIEEVKELIKKKDDILKEIQDALQ